MADVERQSGLLNNNSMTARPHTLQISPSSSNASFEDTDETYSQDLEQESESINGNLTASFRGPKEMYQDSEITRLLKDYAENDASYEGFKVISPTTTSDRFSYSLSHFLESAIRRSSDYDSDDSDDTEKDGIVQSKKKHVNVLSLCVDNTKRLSLYNNGMLLDQVVSTPTSCQGPGWPSQPPCLHIFHHSGQLFKASILQLKPDCSPQLVPVYTTDDPLDYATVIQYHTESIPNRPPTPGSIYVRMESKSHVYLALDYSDSQNPKLITVKDTEMKSQLNEMKKGGDIKIKPIINSRSYPTAQTPDNTTLYFKTDKNYYFLYVDEDALHLEVKTVPIENGKKIEYQHYLNFGPKPMRQCPSYESLEVDSEVDSGASVSYKDGDSSTTNLGGGSSNGEHGVLGDRNMDGADIVHVTKSTIPYSPTSTTPGGAKDSNISPPGSDNSPSTLKLILKQPILESTQRVQMDR